MNTKHLNDILEWSEDNKIKTGELISEYTALAISFSNDGFKPDNFDYQLAYDVIKEKYQQK
jgi:hypothetical protein